MKKISLRQQLMVVGLAMTLVPMVVGFAVAWHQGVASEKKMATGISKQAFGELQHLVDNVTSMCQMYQRTLQNQTKTALNVASDVLARQGSIQLVPNTTLRWKAVNQFSKVAQEIELPKVAFGSLTIDPVLAPDKPAPVVDEVFRLQGGTCTIFQRMNAAGDMLRVATNVQTLEGRRAIGTYIPVTQPDGLPNPVLAQVLRGETYIGRAYVVKGWFTAGYMPLFDAQKKVQGVLYIGTPEVDATNNLRAELQKIVVGQTGYIFALQGSGEKRGTYLLSRGGQRDGESILNTPDADGKPFVEKILTTAKALNSGQVGSIRYPWRNPEEKEARYKTVALGYFQPWDWVIGVGAYDDEFLSMVHDMSRQQSQMRQIQLVLGGIFLVFVTLIWWAISKRLSGSVYQVVSKLSATIEHVAGIARQLATASQALSMDAQSQAAALEQTNAALAQMNGMTQSNAEVARQAQAKSRSSFDSAQQGGKIVERLDVALEEIKKSAAPPAC